MFHYGKKLTKRIAVGVGLLALVALLSSALFVCLETHHHHCHTKDCPVCMCLQQCRETLRQLGDGLPAVIAVLPFLLLSVWISFTYEGTFLPETLVSYKVRLNN